MVFGLRSLERHSLHNQKNQKYILDFIKGTNESVKG